MSSTEIAHLFFAGSENIAEVGRASSDSKEEKGQPRKFVTVPFFVPCLSDV